MAHFRKVTGLLRTMELEYGEFEQRTREVMEELVEGGYGREVLSLAELEEAFAKVHGRERLAEAVVEESAVKNPLEVICEESGRRGRRQRPKEDAIEGKALGLSEWHFGLENLISEVEQKHNEQLGAKAKIAYNFRGEKNLYEVVIDPVRPELDFVYSDKSDVGLDVESTTAGVFVKAIRPETPAAFARPGIRVGDEILLVAGLPANSNVPKELWTHLPFPLTLARRQPLSPKSEAAPAVLLPNQVPETPAVSGLIDL